MNDMTFTKVSNPFFTSPPKWLTWPLDVCGGVGYGWFYWFSRIFSKTSLELEMFSPTYNGERFFSALNVMSDIYVSAGYFFSQEFICMLFSSRNQSAWHFFVNSPIILSKLKLLEPKIHQTFGQLTDSDLSIIARGFWNNRGQNSLGERGGIRFYLPYPERPYGRTVA